MSNEDEEGRRRDQGRRIIESLKDKLSDTLPLPENREAGSQFDERVSRAYAADGDEDRVLMKFGVEWRRFIRRQNPDRLAALDEIIDDRIERQHLAKFYRRMKHLAIATVVTFFAVAQFGVDKLPLIREIWSIVRGKPQ